MINDYGKIPPQAVDIEEAVVASMMLERDCFVNHPVKKEWFYSDGHQKIIECIEEMTNNSIPVDLAQVTKKLKDKGYLADIGGPVYVTKLLRRVSSAAHIEHHIRIIQQEYARRELIRLSAELSKKSFDETLDIDDVFSFAQGELSNIMSFDSEDSSCSYEDATMELIEDLNSTVETGIKTGLSKYDNFTGGLHQSDLVIIAGETSQGKTSLAISILRHIAVKENVPMAVFSTEMTKKQLVSRMTAQQTGISAKEILYNKINKEHKDYLIQELLDAKNRPIYFDDQSNNDIDKICTSIRKLKIKHDIQIVLVDFIQDMKGADTESGVAEIARKLKNIAKELNIVAIGVSQLSRDRNNPRPNMSRLRGSGQLEEKADIIMLIWRPEYYQKNYSEPFENYPTENTAQVIIGKGRNVGIGSFILNFNKPTTNFFDYLKEYSEQQNYSDNPF